jgi:hypothetical protein
MADMAIFNIKPGERFRLLGNSLFVAVPLIFIYIQVSDSGSHEPLVNISVIMTYNLDRSVTILRTEAC